jgi:hypothetical protein
MDGVSQRTEGKREGLASRPCSEESIPCGVMALGSITCQGTMFGYRDCLPAGESRGTVGRQIAN